MSNPRVVVNFAQPLPNDSLTTILGATLACVAKTDNYADFKKCIILPPTGAEMPMGEEMPPGMMSDATATGASVTAAPAMWKGMKKNKK